MAVATWRDHARPIITSVLAENEGKTDKDIRAALRAAYPYGEFAHHPYKIWLDEIAVQMRTKAKKKVDVSPIQTSLF